MSQRLLELEKSGKYLFHGSPSGDIAVLEPRQAKHEGEPDGNPGVSATPYVEFAIFRALVNRVNLPFKHSSGFGFRDSQKEFRIWPAEALDKTKKARGYVYVFDKKDFEPYLRDGARSTMEWRSYKEAAPAEIIEVSYTDFPSGDMIEITDDTPEPKEKSSP